MDDGTERGQCLLDQRAEWAAQRGRIAPPESTEPNACSDLNGAGDTNASTDLIEAAIARLSEDAGAVFVPDVLELLKHVRAKDPSAWARYRQAIKETRAVIMSDLDRLTGDGETSARISPATELADLAVSRCELWHDKDGNAYASFDRSSHREHWQISSAGFKEWLAWLAHSELGSAPAAETISSACNALSGKAKFDGEEHEAHMRVAPADGGIWVDLCDEGWSAVLVTATGWKLVVEPACRFTRTRAMRPLPVPMIGGDFNDIWPLVNIPEEDRPLVLAWLLESLRPGTPYPVLEFIGEQGAAKSTSQSTLRAIIDPNKVMLRARPKTIEDLYVAAGAGHVISLENLSGISADMSDALCTISTGGGSAGRRLYTDSEESIIEAHNPVMLNGIGAVVVRPDLLDRTIAVCCPAISQRITEAEHEAMLEERAGSIMGGLLSLLANSLAALPGVVIPRSDLPRMADFAKLGEAMYRSLGNAHGLWLDLYKQHRRDAIRRTIDSSPVAVACMEYVGRGNTYSGTVGNLLSLFNRDGDPVKQLERGEFWPKNARGLGDQLRRVAPALRQLDIYLSVDSKPGREGIRCRLQKMPYPPPATETPEKDVHNVHDIHTHAENVNVVNVV